MAFDGCKASKEKRIIRMFRKTRKGKGSGLSMVTLPGKARRFHNIFKMGDVIVDPWQVSWFFVHAIRVLGKRIANECCSQYYI